jgi:hypothetical protein
MARCSAIMQSMAPSRALLSSVVAASCSFLLVSCLEQGSPTGRPPSEESSAVVGLPITITSVEPESEEAPSPESGHTIRVSRPDGIDAYPSNDNDAAGTSFTAPCGCVDLNVDSNRVATRRYRKGDAKVSFPGTVALGKHIYQASYKPWNDAAKCADLYFDCPPPPAPYTSGVLTVEAAQESSPAPGASGKFANRAPNTPAWCDPKHHLNKKMLKKHPSKCSGDDQSSLCQGRQDGWWCDATRSGVVFCSEGEVAKVISLGHALASSEPTRTTNVRTQSPPTRSTME